MLEIKPLYKISNSGLLYTNRKGALKRQFCPWIDTDGKHQCGDWCSLFGEPIEVPWGDVIIELRCTGHRIEVKPEYFVDERTGEDESVEGGSQNA